jgi:hypothetical protein
LRKPCMETLREGERESPLALRARGHRRTASRLAD